ncbi:hypothetical protein HSBAA_46930 [Vreelandella sulfidaeris]|uniref:DUF7079 domain-containing protein n=1 Tax=Vreelandella sulfidaeris TaxID=115553 RepID=A0A455UCP3_9GAMM|nr:hypothetical protein HSBAA_46930 [Halomonas sulfidaeris]
MRHARSSLLPIHERLPDLELQGLSRHDSDLSTDFTFEASMNAQQLVDERGDLWLALAPLWLDREPSERDYTRMVEVVQRYDMTLHELEWMFRLEMAPVMSRYQLSIANEWRQFNDRKLMQQLVNHNLRLKGWRRKAWALFSGLTTMMVRHRWNALMSRVAVTRGEQV